MIPMAIPIFGGMNLALLSLFLIPILFYLYLSFITDFEETPTVSSSPTASSSGLTRGSIQKVEKLELSRLSTNDRGEEKMDPPIKSENDRV